MESLCAANTTFALELLTKLCEKKSGQNVFFSPFSISSALSMVLLGSRGVSGCKFGIFLQLERELTYEKLMGWIRPKNMKFTLVNVSLPRFKVEEDYELKPVLSSMGMPEAFESGKADFSGISSGSELVLSEVIHKSFVEVDEEGTEAAAATAMPMCGCSRVMGTAEFTADHPFLFFIRHNKTCSILFCGRFCCP
uniref:Serpin B6 n=1 Tax=Catharus ustulatus TaxID=91951 RepID=A0A8C3TMV5_CATUS